MTHPTATEYRRTYAGTCQLSQAMLACDLVPGYCSIHNPMGQEVHHLFRRGKDRECWPNYLVCCKRHHDLIHGSGPKLAETEPRAYYTLCALWWKWQVPWAGKIKDLHENMQHWNLTELNAAVGKDGGVLGWIQAQQLKSAAGELNIPDSLNSKLNQLLEAHGVTV